MELNTLEHMSNSLYSGTTATLSKRCVAQVAEADRAGLRCRPITDRAGLPRTQNGSRRPLGWRAAANMRCVSSTWLTQVCSRRPPPRRLRPLEGVRSQLTKSVTIKQLFLIWPQPELRNASVHYRTTARAQIGVLRTRTVPPLKKATGFGWWNWG